MHLLRTGSSGTEAVTAGKAIPGVTPPCDRTWTTTRTSFHARSRFSAGSAAKELAASKLHWDEAQDLWLLSAELGRPFSIVSGIARCVVNLSLGGVGSSSSPLLQR